MALPDDLIKILQTDDVSHINSGSDIVTTEDKDAVFNVIQNLRTLISNLYSTDPDTDYNFFAKEFYPIFVEMVTFINERLPDFKNFDAYKIESLIVEAVSHQISKFNYLGSRLVQQLIIDLCDDYNFMLLHAKSRGYLVGTGVSSRVKLHLLLDSPASNDVYYEPATSPTFSTTDGNFSFEIEENIDIPSGGSSAVFYVRNRIRQVASFNVLEGAVEYTLSGSPFLSEDIKVLIDSIEWTLVDNFHNSLSTDTHYTYRLNNRREGILILNFADDGSALEVEYYVGGLDLISNRLSEANQIIPFFINKVDHLEDIGGETISRYTIYNETYPTGGRDVDSLADIRRGIRAKNAKSDQSISPLQFEKHSVEGSTNVIRALAFDPQRARRNGIVLASSDDLSSKLIIYLVNKDMGDLVNNEETDIISYIATEKGSWNGIISEVGESNVTFLPATYKDIEIEGTVYFKTENFDSQLTTIETAIWNFFEPDAINLLTGEYNLHWGMFLPIIGISNIIREIENNFGEIGQRVVLDSPTGSIIELDTLEFPRLVSVTLTGEVI